MKVRTGFVSNSSSCSFSIYGVCLDKEEAKKKMVSTVADVNFQEELEKYGAMSMLDSARGLYVSCGPDDYSGLIYAGLSWDSIGDDETGNQFKERARTILSKLLGEDISLGTYEEAWYNG